MKKIMLLILSVGLLGAAQAVTSRWDNWQSVIPSGSDPTNKVGWVNGTDAAMFSPNADFALKVTLSLTEGFDWKGSTSDSNGIIFMLRTNTLDPGSYGFQVNKEKQVLVDDWGQGVSPVVSDVTLTAGQDYTFMFAYSDGRLSAYLNEQLLTTYALDGWASIEEIDFGCREGGYNKLNAFIDGYELGNLQYSTTMLPEPTALALLALGVAGVALRRRVA